MHIYPCLYTIANVVRWAIKSSRDWNVNQLVGVTRSTYLVQQLNTVAYISYMSMCIKHITVLFLLSDAKLAPMTSEQVTEMPDTSSADTSYETSSVVSTSILSQITKVIKAQETLVKLQLEFHVKINFRVLSWSPHLVNRIQKSWRRQLLMQILAMKQAVCSAHPAHLR